MKKSLALITLLASLSFAFGQGQVAFANTYTTLTSTNLPGNSGLGGPTSTVVPSYYYGIFWAPSTEFNPDAFTWFGNYGTNLAAAGRFFGGQGTTHSPAIPGEPIGSTVNILVRAWSANFTAVPTTANYASDGGAAWWDVKASLDTEYLPHFVTRGAGFMHRDDFWYGESEIATLILGGGPIPIMSPFGPYVGELDTGITLEWYTTMPEPSAFALVGLASAVLLISRRRK